MSAFSQPIQKGHMIDYQIPKWVYKEVFEYNKMKPLVKLDSNTIKKTDSEVSKDYLQENIYPSKVRLINRQF